MSYNEEIEVLSLRKIRGCAYEYIAKKFLEDIGFFGGNDGISTDERRGKRRRGEVLVR